MLRIMLFKFLYRLRFQQAFQIGHGQGAQLAAYAASHFGTEALPKCLLANIYISTTEPGRMEVCKHADAPGEYDYFLHCAAVWRHLKSYDPRQPEAVA